jgi:hypothetical protein
MIWIAVIIGIIVALVVLFLGFGIFLKELRRSYRESDGGRKENEKLRYIIRMYNLWLMEKGEGKNIADYLRTNGCIGVVIYGMSDLGVRLAHELEDSEVKVLYAMDRDIQISLHGIEVFHGIKDSDGTEDAVIVTNMSAYDQIRKELVSHGFKKIICIDEILYAMAPTDKLMTIKSEVKGEEE